MRLHKHLAPSLCVAGFASAVYGASPLALDVKRYFSVSNETIFRAQLPYVSVAVGTPAQQLYMYLDVNHGDIVVNNQTTPNCDDPDLNAGTTCDWGIYHQDASTTSEPQSSMSIVSTGSEGYGDASVIEDTVKVGDVLFPNMVVVVSRNSTSVLGIGGNASQELTNSSYLNLPMSLKQEGATDIIGFSLYLQHSNTTTLGRLVFGGIETTKFTGLLETLPIHRSQADSLSPGNIVVTLSDMSLATGDGVQNSIDGTQNLQIGLGPSWPGMSLPPSAFQQVLSLLNLTEAESLTKAQFGEAGVVLPYGAIQNETTIDLQFGATTIKIPIWDLMLPFNTTHGLMYIANSTSLPWPLPFIGADFFRNAYSVFDFTNDQLSIAPLNYDVLSSDNIIPINDTGVAGLTGSEPPSTPGSNSSPKSSNWSIGAEAGLGAGISLGIILLAGVVFFIFYKRYRSRKGCSTKVKQTSELPAEPRKTETVGYRPVPSGRKYEPLQPEEASGSLSVALGSLESRRSDTIHELP